MANSKRTCKCCGESYQADKPDAIVRGLNFFASMDHLMEHVRTQDSIKHFRATEKQAKERRKQHRADKERIKPRSQRLKEAQASINKYVRLRDKGKPCVSCDKPDNGQHQRHASHYKSVGSNSALRFNLRNIHASCSVCNNHLSGNIGEYTPRLIAKIGRDKYDWLLTQNHAVKYDDEYLERLKRIFNKRARILIKKIDNG